MAEFEAYLSKSRPLAKSRAHFAFFVPNKDVQNQLEPTSETQAYRGAKIHVVGAPMVGFAHEFKRNYDANSQEAKVLKEELIPIGPIADRYVSEPGEIEVGDTPRTDLERLASTLPPPRISQNFMAPVNETTNRRCQEWMLDFIRLLVSKGCLGPQAIDIVQNHRDPPDFGIGLRPV